MESAHKRSLNEDSSFGPEIKLEIINNIFLVICVFRNSLYIHIRKYVNRYPTKEGVSMNPDEWKFVAEVLYRESDKKISAPLGSLLVQRNKNKSATITNIVKGSTIYLTNDVVANINIR